MQLSINYLLHVLIQRERNAQLTTSKLNSAPALLRNEVIAPPLGKIAESLERFSLVREGTSSSCTSSNTSSPGGVDNSLDCRLRTNKKLSCEACVRPLERPLSRGVEAQGGVSDGESSVGESIVHSRVLPANLIVGEA